MMSQQSWSDDGVRQERTGWRCPAISQRHREWGYNCPAVDLDFVVVEYNYGKPVVLIEYKDRHALQPNLNHATYRALTELAGPLPFIIAFYDPEIWWFRVVPVNDSAKRHYKHCANQPLTEQRFVRSLYLLRKAVLDENDEAAIARLNNDLPEAETQ